MVGPHLLFCFPLLTPGYRLPRIPLSQLATVTRVCDFMWMLENGIEILMLNHLLGTLSDISKRRDEEGPLLV